MTNAAWIDGMKGRSVLDVARELDMAVDERRHAASPCPACNATTRHTKSSDRRGALGLRRDGLGWRCFQCPAKGDAIDLVAHRIGGARLRDLGDARKAEVRAWCESFLGLDSSRPMVAPAWRAPGKPTAAAAPTYPPRDEVASLWAACAPVTTDPDVARWLDEERGILSAEVERLDLARVLPKAAQCPAWAGAGDGPSWRSWGERGARLLVPLFDAEGSLRSLIARHPYKVEAGLKSRNAKGFARAGLVMANGRALSWLNGTNAAAAVCFILEGEPDFLLSAVGPAKGQTWASIEKNPAVFGVVEGAWVPALALRIPDDSHVAVATDDDEPGDTYARKIGETIATRVALGSLKATRQRPTRAGKEAGMGLDVSDVDGLDGTTSEPLFPQAQRDEEAAKAKVEADANAPPPKPAPPDPFKEMWKPIDVSWLTEAPKEPEWLLRRTFQRGNGESDTTGFLPRGKVGMIAAEGGAGKTMALIQLALAVATGIDWLEYQTAPPNGRVLIALGEEDEMELRRRIYRAFESMWPGGGRARDEAKEQARQDIHKRIVALPLAGMATPFVTTNPRTKEVEQTPAFEALQRKLEEGGERWSLIILDPLSRFAGAETETDNAAATRFVQAIESLPKVNGNPNVLLAHHTTKGSRREGNNDASSARGSSALSDGVRWHLSMEPERGLEAELGLMPSKEVHIKLVKTNCGPYAPRITVIREEEGTLRVLNAGEKAAAARARAQQQEDAKGGNARGTTTKKPDSSRAKPSTIDQSEDLGK